MALIMHLACQALAALPWLSHPSLSPPQNCTLCRMLQRPTSPFPEENFIDNPGRKLKLHAYIPQGDFLLQQVFPQSLPTSEFI